VGFASSLLGMTLSLFAAVVPTAIYALLIWWCDRYEREPWALLAVAFVWGAVPAVIVSVLAETLFGASLAGLQAERLAGLLEVSGMAPVVEEVTKALALVGLFLFFRSEFDDVLDGVIYGALVGIGFGMTENLFYFLSAFFAGGWVDWGTVVFLRVLVFGLNHAFYTAFSGVGLGVARLARSGWQRWLMPLAGLGAAIVFHGLHNLGISLADVAWGSVLLSLLSDSGGILVLLVVLLLAWRQERHWIRTELREEIGGLLTAAEHEAASAYGQRLRVWWAAWRRGGWKEARRQGRLHRLFTELAFRKHRLRVLGEEREGAILAEIEQLRLEIAALRREARAMLSPA